MQLKLATNGFFNGNGLGNGIVATPGIANIPQAKHLLAIISVPRNNNTGEMFSAKKIQQAIDYIIDVIGGGTEYPPSIGYWDNERGRDVDHISVIQVVAPYTLKTLHCLYDIAETLEKELEQDDIFIFCTPAYFLGDLLAFNEHILRQHSEEDPETDLGLIPA